MVCKPIPAEVLRLVCLQSSIQELEVLQHVSSLWRYLALPFLWANIDISQWAHISSPQDIHGTYGKHVRSLEYTLHCTQRRRSSSTSSRSTAPINVTEGMTKTQILCEWLQPGWKHVRRVSVSAWPPYNVYRVQGAISAACPRIQTLVLEGAVNDYIGTLQTATVAFPLLRNIHITEDTRRALLPPAADHQHPNHRLQSQQSPSLSEQLDLLFASNAVTLSLTHLTVPCLAASANQLLADLPEYLPALQSLNLRQIDAGIANRLCVSLPQHLKQLATTGHHPLNLRMFGGPEKKIRYCTLLRLTLALHSLKVTGSRTEEAAQSEFTQFWLPLLKSRWPQLRKLVVHTAYPELGQYIKHSCPGLEYLKFCQAGSFVDQQHNDVFASHLTNLQHLRFLDIASSNNEFEGCRLSSNVATKYIWKTTWLHTLHISRMFLAPVALVSLTQMLPYLDTLWFTLDDTTGYCPEKPNDNLDKCRLRYLIIHAFLSDAVGYSNLSSVPSMPSTQDSCSISDPESFHLPNTAASVASCLALVPTVNRCRLPMFTFPDHQRLLLRHKFPDINFTKYAPPY